MVKKLTVKEYDRIIRSQTLANINQEPDGRQHCLPPKIFDNLKTFIEEFNNETSKSDALDFMKIDLKRNYGYVITVRNYVGLIQMKDGTQIEILPKLTSDNERVVKEIFIKMIRSLKEFSGKAFKYASLNVDRMSIYEILINMYLQEVRHLIKKGIKSFYEQKEDNLRIFKGKLKVKEHQRLNFVHKERFYVEFDEYTTNRPENRLIKSTLLKLQQLSNYIGNLKEIKNLLNSFELIDTSFNYDSDFSKVIINRSNKEYETIMNWSKIFLYNKSFTTFSGSTTARALLFPMEKVFESYIASEFKKGAREEGWKISTQDRGFHLFDEPKTFSLQPDIVITKNDGETLIMDTKWKMLKKGIRNYGVSQSDMYQMYAYAKKYKAKKVFVIYPLNQEMYNYKDTSIAYKSDEDITIHLTFIDLLNINESIKNLVSMME